MQRSTIDSLLEARRELGPLRYVAFYLVVAATIGTVTVVANLAAIERALPADRRAAFAAVAAGVAIATAVAVVVPSVTAFAAGWLLGAAHGWGAAVVGAGAGAWLAQRVVAPRAGGQLFAFMAARSRAIAVRRFCGDHNATALCAVARLRWASVMPAPVTHLLFAVVRTPGLAVFAGSLLGAVPMALFFAIAGDCWRAWRAADQAPEAASLIGAGAALVASAMVRRASRRQWRRVDAAA